MVKMETLMIYTKYIKHTHTYIYIFFIMYVIDGVTGIKWQGWLGEKSGRGAFQVNV